MNLRVKDGQQIEVDISFQYQLDKSTLLQLYRDYKFTYHAAFRKAAQAKMRDVAAGFHAEEFFHNRTLIESEMLNTLRAEIEARHAKLIGLQVRSIDLPDKFESRLEEIELKKQEAQKAAEDILLAQIEAETNKQLLEMRSNKDKLEIQLSQQTENLRLEILQDETETREETDRLVNEMSAELNEFITVWNQETENRKVEILHNKTIIEQNTAQEVAELDARTQEELDIFNQQTTNLRLAILRNVTLEEQRTQQSVSLLEAELAEYKRSYEQETRNLVAEVMRNVTLVKEETAALLSAIGNTEKLSVAQTTSDVAAVRASAESFATRRVDTARADAQSTEAAVVADSLEKMQTGASQLTPEHLLYLEWVKAYGSTADNKPFVDMDTPELLKFPANLTAANGN